MNKLLYKEMRLSASPLSYLFIAAGLLTFVPSYPILVGAFFSTLGIFYSFQSTRENNDIGYSLLLPIAKRDIVRSKFYFCLFIELCTFALMALITLVRMLFLNTAPVYAANALMNANLTFLGFALLIFGVFNAVFVGGFFRTGYYFGRPFITYCVVAMLLVGAAETLHHLPGLGALNAAGFDSLAAQLIAFVLGLLLFALLTLAAMKKSEDMFEKIDL